ncbi:FAD-dependent oxidoreductase [Phototrophicus methaneseepsis]|uniref:monodehydroascorbate reductase (NADH) n=1 Tax=Phototrophicus methaneseepsis TaxID=2710758 RepID=A0A7S8IG13_9CHLR|nr:FAD-dependent oxidoreductase [Phototrophicus methaneseepsis]QPC84059.1 FAD-dependent oxidoreductase [Phototrophicus methaneseepsis]
MKRFKYIILGGGIVAGYAVQEFAKVNGFNSDDIAIITADNTLPYERPSLSKDFLTGDEQSSDLHINKLDFYHKHGIKVYLYTTVEDIDPVNRILKTDHGDSFVFEKLLIATGSHPRRLDVPGHDLPNIYYLRTLSDAKEIRRQFHLVERITIIGGGYIGMEAAAAAATEGAQVTVVFPEERLMSRFFTEDLSSFFEKYYEARGVTFIRHNKVVGFQTSKKGVRVQLEVGNDIEADAVIVGIGAEPNVDLARPIQLDVDDGIIVNEHLMTTIDGIYAAGDVANFFDRIFEKRRRVEHWQNAVDQARYVARHMLGQEKESFSTLRYFFSDIFDLSYEFWGETEDATQAVHIGSFTEDPSFGVWWLRDNRLIGSLLLNRPDDERQNAQKWIMEPTSFDMRMLDQLAQRTADQST